MTIKKKSYYIKGKLNEPWEAMFRNKFGSNGEIKMKLDHAESKKWVEKPKPVLFFFPYTIHD